jgi:nitroreductase
MDLHEAIFSRRSVRAYKSDPVPRDVLDRLAAAAAAAPSAWNAQPAHFHFTSGLTREAIGQALTMSTRHLDEYVSALPPENMEAAQSFFADLGGAPVVAAVSVPRGRDELDRINNYLAAGCAIENVLLAAVDEGLGTCSITFSFWVRDRICEILAMPSDRDIISLMLIGYPAEIPVAPAHSPDIATFHE